MAEEKKSIEATVRSIRRAVRSNMLARLVDGEPKAWAKYDDWPAGAITEIDHSPNGKARLIRLKVYEHLHSLRSSQ